MGPPPRLLTRGIPQPFHYTPYMPRQRRPIGGHPAKQFKCDYPGCDKSYYQQTNLTSHQVYKHGRERRSRPKHGDLMMPGLHDVESGGIESASFLVPQTGDIIEQDQDVASSLETEESQDEPT